MAQIIKGTDAIPVEHPIFLLLGQPGIGKTSLGYSMKEPLLLDFDKGAHRATNRRDTLVINTWADVVELTSDPAVLAPYSSIVVDTVGRCLDLITADIAANDPKKAPGGNLSMQGWGVLKNRFRTWMAALRAQGKDVLLLAHDKEDKDGDTRVVRPEIPGGSYGEVMKVADFVGYLYLAGKDRVLDFNPNERWIGKNPGGWPAMAVPPAPKATTLMADLVDKGREALGNISGESAKVAQVVDTWRDWIADLDTPEHCTEAIAKINATDAILQPQLKKLLLDRATALDFVFDTKTKAFIVKSQPAATEPAA